jgi:hypothetical protein
MKYLILLKLENSKALLELKTFKKFLYLLSQKYISIFKALFWKVLIYYIKNFYLVLLELYNKIEI